MKRSEVQLLLFLTAAGLAEWPIVSHFRPDLLLLFLLPIAKIATAMVLTLLIVSSNFFRRQTEPPALSNWVYVGVILVASVIRDIYFLGVASADC